MEHVKTEKWEMNARIRYKYYTWIVAFKFYCIYFFDLTLNLNYTTRIVKM